MKQIKFTIVKDKEWKIKDDGQELILLIPSSICFGVGVRKFVDDISDVVEGLLPVEKLNAIYKMQSPTPIVLEIIHALQNNKDVHASFDTKNLTPSQNQITGILFIEQ